LYLIVFGSVVAFTAYIWLLRITTAARVGTHAYVNPIVAVALGAALGGEHVSLLTLASALTIVAGVVLVLVEQSRPAQAAAPSALPPPPRGAKKAAAAIRLA
jgi:drug/metabolite transporter (DMT)-like permease